MFLVRPQRVFLRRTLRTLRRAAARARASAALGHAGARRIAAFGALVVVLAACVGGFIAAMLARAAPTWWVTVLREDPAVVQTARSIENQVMSRVYQDRALETGAEPAWTIEIPAEKANAWLNVRLPMWLANQKDKFRWPREMSDLQVNFADNRITVGARVRAGGREQVLTATIEPRLEDGRLYIPARWIGVGRLPIPADWVLDRAHQSAELYIPANLRALPETEALFRAFAGEQAIRSNTVINLRDGRAVRILAFSTRGDTLRITCRTEHREQASR